MKYHGLQKCTIAHSKNKILYYGMQECAVKFTRFQISFKLGKLPIWKYLSTGLNSSCSRFELKSIHAQKPYKTVQSNTHRLKSSLALSSTRNGLVQIFT